MTYVLVAVVWLLLGLAIGIPIGARIEKRRLEREKAQRLRAIFEETQRRKARASPVPEEDS